MGNRGNIIMKYSDGNKIYFYSHNGGDNETLKSIIKSALIRGKDRWSDESYLARIIFSEMIKDYIMETTGFGISSYQIEDGGLIEVDIKNQKVGEQTFEEFIQ